MAVCSVDGCTTRVDSRGWCRKHYQRWIRKGTTDLNPPWQPGPLVCDCTTPTPTPTDMCATCYRVIADLVHARRLLKNLYGAHVYDPPPRPRGIA